VCLHSILKCHIVIATSAKMDAQLEELDDAYFDEEEDENEGDDDGED
jgi:hypothetical protein